MLLTLWVLREVSFLLFTDIQYLTLVRSHYGTSWGNRERSSEAFLSQANLPTLKNLLLGGLLTNISPQQIKFSWGSTCTEKPVKYQPSATSSSTLPLPITRCDH